MSAIRSPLEVILAGARCGSRDLDADIYEALFFKVERAPRWKYLSGSRWYALQHPTSSVDDGLSLLETMCSDWTLDRIGSAPENAPGRWDFEVDLATRYDGRVRGVAATIPLALCVAIVRTLGRS